MKPDDETAVTDIEIAADGRVYVFGASDRVLEILEEIGAGNEQLQQRLAVMRSARATVEVKSSQVRESHE